MLSIMNTLLVILVFSHTVHIEYYTFTYTQTQTRSQLAVKGILLLSFDMGCDRQV